MGNSLGFLLTINIIQMFAMVHGVQDDTDRRKKYTYITFYNLLKIYLYNLP